MRRRPGIALALFMAVFGALSVHAAPLYDLLPDTTLVAIHMQEPARALPRKLVNPVLRRALPRAADADRFAELLARLPGPMLLGVVHKPGGQPQDQSLIVAADLRTGDDIDKLTSTDALPLFGDLMNAKLTLETKGAVRRVLRDESVLFTYAVKDNRLLGSTDRALVSDWLKGEYPKTKWVSDHAIRNWIGGLPKDATLRVLFNPIPLVKDISTPKRNTYEALFMQVLAPEDVRAVGGDLVWDRDSLSLDLTAVFSEKARGIARALQLAPQTSRTLGMFPDDFTAIGRIGWPSAAALINGAYSVLDRVDPDIGAEYREELVDFKNETGVDFEADLAANLVGEIGYGVRIDFSNPNPIAWAVACPLAEPQRFARQLDVLLKHFGVSTTRQSTNGIDVQTSLLKVPFAFGMAADRLIVADSPQTIGELASQTSRRGLDRPRSDTLDACLRHLAAPNNACVMIDLERLGRSLGPFATALGRNKALFSTGCLGFSLTHEQNAARARLTWMVGARQRMPRDSAKPGAAETMADSAPAPIELAADLMEQLMGGVDAAQMQSQRLVSASNMRGVGQGLYIYAQEHKDQFPPDLAELVRRGMITTTMLTSPYDGTGPANADEVAEKCAYIYRGGLSASSDPAEIVLAERSAGADGANFLFVDGHTEFAGEPEASELIAKIQRGEKSVRLARDRDRKP